MTREGIIKKFTLDMEAWATEVGVYIQDLECNDPKVMVKRTKGRLVVQLRTLFAKHDTCTVEKQTHLDTNPWNLFKASIKYIQWMPQWITKRIDVIYYDVPIKTVFTRICPHIKGEDGHLSWITDQHDYGGSDEHW
jgi:hypothetical protein